MFSFPLKGELINVEFYSLISTMEKNMKKSMKKVFLIGIMICLSTVGVAADNHSKKITKTKKNNNTFQVENIINTQSETTPTIIITTSGLNYNFSSTDTAIIGSDINNPTLTLAAGESYTFQHAGTGHPFKITIGNIEQTISSGSSITIDIPSDQSEDGNYVCTLHPSMSNTVLISESSNDVASTLTVGSSYIISLSTSDLIKWVQQGSDNELGARQDNGTWETNDTLMTIWTITDALDASNGTYSIQSAYDSSAYIHATIYSSDTDLAHVYESSDEAYSSSEFSFEIVDASTISDAYSGYVIYYVNNNTNYYLIPKEVSNKDFYFMDLTSIASQGLTLEDAILTFNETTTELTSVGTTTPDTPNITSIEYLLLDFELTEIGGTYEYSTDLGSNWTTIGTIASSAESFLIPTPNINIDGFFDSDGVWFRQVSTDGTTGGINAFVDTTEPNPPTNISYSNNQIIVEFSESYGFYKFSIDGGNTWNNDYIEIINENTATINTIPVGNYASSMIHIIQADFFGNESSSTANEDAITILESSPNDTIAYEDVIPENIPTASTGIDFTLLETDLTILLDEAGGTINISIDSGTTWSEVTVNSTETSIEHAISEGIYDENEIIIHQIDAQNSINNYVIFDERVIAKLNGTILNNPYTGQPMDEYFIEFEFNYGNPNFSATDSTGDDINIFTVDGDNINIQMLNKQLFNIKNNSIYELIIYNQNNEIIDQLQPNETKLVISEIGNYYYQLENNGIEILTGDIDVVELNLKDIEISIMDSLTTDSIIVDINAHYSGENDIVYSITSGNDDGLFNINNITGEISLTNVLGSTTEYNLTIQVEEDTTATTQLIDSASMTINILTSITSSSTEMEFSNISTEIREHAPNGRSIYDLNNNLTNNDTSSSGYVILYSIISGNDDGLFAINPISGIISVNDSNNLDYETLIEHTLEIEVATGEEISASIIDETITFFLIINLKDTADTISDSTGIPEEIRQISNGKLAIGNETNFDSNFGDLDNDTMELEINANSTVNAIEMKIKKLILGDIETAIVRMESGAKINATDTITLGEAVGTIAELFISDNDSEITSSSDITIGESGKGTLTMSNGRAQIDQDFNVGELSEGEGIINISGGAILKISRNFNIADEGTATINHTGGTISVSGTMNVGANGSFNMDYGDLISEEINIDPDATFSFTGGTIQTPLIDTNDGTFVNSGGTLSAGEYEDTTSSIEIMGISTMGLGTFSITDIINEQINIIGDYIQEYGDTYISNLSIQLNSSDESENGKLIVTGTATLDGELTISSASGLTFEIDQVFQLIEAEEILGSFSTISLPDLESDLEWNLNSLYTTGTLSISESESTTIIPVSMYTYPNPVTKSDTTYIYYNLLLNHNTTLEIYNIFGKKIHSETFSSGENGGKSGDNLVELSTTLLNKLSISTYFVVLHNGNSILGNGKFSIK